MHEIYFYMEEILDTRERLSYIIKLTGKKQFEFANIIGVSPAAISHRMSSSAVRKDDMSENLANRILAAFPNLGFTKEWIMTGKVSDAPIGASISEVSAFGRMEPSAAQPSLFDFNQNSVGPNGGGVGRSEFSQDNSSTQSVFSVEEPSNSYGVNIGVNFGVNSASQVYPQQPNPHVVSSDSNTGTNSNSQIPSNDDSVNHSVNSPFTVSNGSNGGGLSGNGNSVNEAVNPSGRFVERIVMFYSDGTFVEYCPVKK